MKDDEMDPFVFAILPEKAEKTFKSENKDVVSQFYLSCLLFFFFFCCCCEIDRLYYGLCEYITKQKMFATNMAMDGFPPRLKLLTDSKEHARKFLTYQVVNTLKTYQDDIILIHFTDRSTRNPKL